MFQGKEFKNLNFDSFFLTTFRLRSDNAERSVWFLEFGQTILRSRKMKALRIDNFVKFDALKNFNFFVGFKDNFGNLENSVNSEKFSKPGQRQKRNTAGNNAYCL